MLRIAICDDEKLFRENIKKYVLKYLSEKDISSEIDMFNSGKELLGQIYLAIILFFSTLIWMR